MKTKALIWLYGAVLIFISLFTFWGFSSEMGVEKAGKILGEQMNSKMSESPGEEVHLSEIAQFNWDTVYIAHPYSNLDKIEKELDINLNEVQFTQIDQRDDVCLLLFIDDKKLIKPILVPRHIFDFSKEKSGIITRDKAIFFKKSTRAQLVENN
ncbi:hypothetical protein [Chondrinema litorale]|uniref:hypothetical protein n=1 Tax=Chondrinema litorale TaxID=2994555 RepID=UPI0025428F1C|nr:hypothetical protein [Chondrinema litorale]UZR94837.1 hypothetical protein OQ292_03285 [Chondrinema litorale]